MSEKVVSLSNREITTPRSHSNLSTSLINERVFGLTDAGREFVEEYLTEDRERPDSYQMRIERLEDEVDDLQRTNERLEVKVDQQSEHLKDLENRFDTLLDRFEEQLF